MASIFENTSRYTSLRGQCLIAMPSLKDSFFEKSVTYICKHNDQGAMGLVLTSPLEMTMKDILGQMSLEDLCGIGETQVLSGGPVSAQRGFVLHDATSDWESTLHVSQDVKLTASRDIISALAEGVGPQKSLFALGYAGWDAGQLEQEITENSWLTIDADSDMLFDTSPEKRWQLAVEKLGIDPHLLPVNIGHA